MSMTAPNKAELAAIAAHYGLELGDEDLETYQELIGGIVGSYDVVERLYAEIAPHAPADRVYEWPQPQQNLLGAWYAKTNINKTQMGPLAGQRIVLKDTVALAGVPMMMGSKIVEGFTPDTDATVVTRLLDAGATLVGKAVCEDLCLSSASHTSASGPVRNPWDTSRTSGGSSSGCAVLVATGEVDGAIGGDQAGSIRVPSAFCGIVGHKPTHGLVPYTGVGSFEDTLDHLGPLSRTAAGAAQILTAIAGVDGLDPRQHATGITVNYSEGLHSGVDGMRIGVLREGFAWPGSSEPEVDQTVRAAVDRLVQAGATAMEVSVPWHRDAIHLLTVLTMDGGVPQLVDGNGYGMNSTRSYDPEFIVHFAKGRHEHPEYLAETVKLSLLAGHYSMEKYDGRYYAMVQDLAVKLAEAYDGAFDDVDVLVMPTVPFLPKHIPAPDVSRAAYIGAAMDGITNTCGFDLSGHPATSFPAGLAKGLPVGMMVVAPQGADALTLRVAQAYETLVGGFPVPPEG